MFPDGRGGVEPLVDLVVVIMFDQVVAGFQQLARLLADADVVQRLPLAGGEENIW